MKTKESPVLIGSDHLQQLAFDHGLTIEATADRMFIRHRGTLFVARIEVAA